MKDLSTLRQEIDEIDDQIVELISKRFKVTDEIGLVKANNFSPAADTGREDQILSRLEERSLKLSLDPELISSIFRSIFAEVVKKHNKLT